MPGDRAPGHYPPGQVRIGRTQDGAQQIEDHPIGVVFLPVIRHRQPGKKQQPPDDYGDGDGGPVVVEDSESGNCLLLLRCCHVFVERFFRETG